MVKEGKDIFLTVNIDEQEAALPTLRVPVVVKLTLQRGPHGLGSLELLTKELLVPGLGHHDLDQLAQPPARDVTCKGWVVPSNRRCVLAWLSTVGFQYAAEITHPAPESTSQGLLLLVGQISGILFILGMNAAGMIVSLYVFVGLAFITILLTLMLRESKMIQN